MSDIPHGLVVPTFLRTIQLSVRLPDFQSGQMGSTPVWCTNSTHHSTNGRSSDSQSENTGSIPVWCTNFKSLGFDQWLAL
jgi:hypothetical protein